MGELITLEREEDRPRLTCPHCKQAIYVDIDPWKKDITFMSDKCPKCHGQIIVGLLMIVLTSVDIFAPPARERLFKLESEKTKKKKNDKKKRYCGHCNAVMFERPPWYICPKCGRQVF